MSEATPSEVGARTSSEGVRRREMLLLAGASLAISVTTSFLALGRGAASTLGIYFDGHFYIEIARSFPFPFSPEGLDYLAQAPAYPALIYLGRLLTPDLLNWGSLAIAATWLPATTAVVAFYLLARELDVPAFQASLTFLLVNPVWALLISAPHPEPLAMTAALLCFTAHLRGHLPWSVFWLSIAVLGRFPAVLLGLPLAFDLLIARRQRTLRSIAWLAFPLAVFGLYNLYLYLHIPDFGGIWQAHQVHWEADRALPFSELVGYWKASRHAGLFQRQVIYGTAAFYLAAMLLGLRPSERGNRWLALWVAGILFFHVSLSGKAAVTSFTRLAVLAWPAALLIAWRCRPRPLPPAVLAPLCTAAACLSIWISYHQIGAAVYLQNQYGWMMAKMLQIDSDEPHWVDFREARLQDWIEKRERERREARKPR